MPRVMSLPPQAQIDDDKIPLSSPELVGSIGQQPPGSLQAPSDRRVIESDLRRMATVRETIDREEWERVFNIPKENPEVNLLFSTVGYFVRGHFFKCLITQIATSHYSSGFKRKPVIDCTSTLYWSTLKILRARFLKARPNS